MEESHVVRTKVGVIGCGYWGPKLARNFHELEESDLSMVCDRRDERLMEMADLYPEVSSTTREQDVFEADLDAIVIATPVNTHFPLARRALAAGKHVLVEKPITARSEHARELIRLAEKNGLILMVGHTFEYNPAVEAVREIVQSGRLGRIYYVNSTRVNLGLLQPDINVMWDLAPHDISIIRFVLGSDPTKVSARGSYYVNTYGGLHEIAYIVMNFGNGVLANLHVSWLDPVKQRKLTIIGSEKMLVYDDIADEKVIVYDKGVKVPPYSVTENEFHASYRHGDEEVVPIKWVEPLRKECSEFLRCIREGGMPRSDADSGLKVVTVLETAQKSILNGGVELQIDYLKLAGRAEEQ